MVGAGIVMASTIFTVREARLGKPEPPAERVD
jgi:hypothetical protein